MDADMAVASVVLANSKGCGDMDRAGGVIIPGHDVPEDTVAPA
jgi:hypothetical protein